MSRSRNRLGEETSPYLLQHASNPVDWYPWGTEALQRASADDKPILLSVGYAACHWCHVMERESFEDPATAELMNEHFVCIKVDREERPDIDDIYMRAVQMMTGQGGWPLTAFLAADLRPFFGGTYYPPEPRHGMPSFTQVLRGIVDAYANRRDEIEATGAQLLEHLQTPRASRTQVSLDHTLIQRAARELHERFDPNYGGFGAAPKFPNSMSISLLLRHAAAHNDTDLLYEALFTLDQMAGGGIYDQVGGGFHRYATDARWLVPHFEKMLYDNALLATTYMEAYQIAGKRTLADTVSETLDWVIREMQSSDGGYYSTLDADSEGVEGKYYVWDQSELQTLLGDDAEILGRAYGVSANGNWEGTNILHLPRPLELLASELDEAPESLRERLAGFRSRLREARDGRIRPGLDDKILSDWNGLMIAAMARGYRVLGDQRYLASATGAADFVMGSMRRDGRLLHTHRAGTTKLLAYLDGYANMLWACVELFESTFELRWLRYARELADGLIELFGDDGGGFSFTGKDHEELLTTSKAGHDGATPAGNAVAAIWLHRLARLTGDKRYAEAARQTLDAFVALMERMPSAFAQMSLALDAQLAEQREVVVLGCAEEPATKDALAELWRQFAPHEIVVRLDPDAPDLTTLEKEVPLLAGKASVAATARPLYFACRDYACAAPTADLDEVIGSN
ncbi:MAG TPA: thioredoxin domain-containing protein [Acidobacteriota bacterium]|nr:thioredoxin domain-containing protein [Acidobacteriota bacterium]